ncbi:MAG: bifunctional metallophosphatase/5'-nucleotidase [Lachnospiraceae bacterium]|nr:bifunctional metallophosphatase/5'-nucleotidase [Lachnospiraceae bacterium]
MKKFLARLCAFALIIAMLVPANVSRAATYDPDVNFKGKTVILHTNDVHGKIAGYTYTKALKATYERAGAEVILVDAGDYSQGQPEVSVYKGLSAIKIMNRAHYDYATLGNHEFDYGWPQLKKNLKKAKFTVLCADVFDENGKILEGCKANDVYKTKSGLKIGFFGLETPEAQTKTNPALIEGLKFVAGKDLYACAQAQVDELAKKSDVIICLSHLGVDASSEPNTSYDLAKNTTGIDFIIDGHSHTVMEAGPNGEKIQSTGTELKNIGVIVIDNKTKKIEDNYLIAVDETLPTSKLVAKKTNKYTNKINELYGVVFGKSEVDLNGDKAPGNRTEETNLGDLITDAMLAAVLKDKDSLVTVDEDHILAITNGGGIRASVPAGDITKKQLYTVLPFGNTVTVVYVTGAELLEALEASCFDCPNAVGGFPQVSGIKFTIDTTKAYKANAETYPGSTYYGPSKITRVSIDSINGKKFSKTDTYAVITNNFVAAGGDTYYVFKAASAYLDTGITLDQALMDYVLEKLGGTIGSDYAKPQGRITVK